MRTAPPRILALVTLALAATTAARAVRPPVQAVTTADGLPHERVMDVTEDARGFVWFATAGGLARYDGERLVRYGSEHGLTTDDVRTVRDTPEGDYWIGTDQGGLFRFDPSRSPARFEAVPLEGGAATITAFARTADGTLWAGSTAGLYRGVRAAGAVHWARVDVAPELPRPVIWTLLPEPSGGLWIGTDDGLFRRCPSARVAGRAVALAGTHDVRALARDGRGRLLAGGVGGLSVLGEGSCDGEPRLLRDDTERLRAQDLGRTNVRALLVTRAGQLWIGTNGELQRLHDGIVERYSTDDGLTDETVRALVEDRSGNVWAATDQGGALRFSPEGFHAYREQDGLELAWTSHLVLDADGEVVAAASLRSFGRVDGHRVVQVGTPLPPHVVAVSLQQGVAIDRAGAWWMPTPLGLFRYARPARFTDLPRARPAAVLGADNGLPTDVVDRAWTDDAGHVWLGAASRGLRWLARCDRASGRPHVFGPEDGLDGSGAAVAFTDDGAGGVLVGFDDGRLARFDGTRFTAVAAGAGLPAGPLGALHTGPSGRVWIGGRGAIAELRDARTAAPAARVLPLGDALRQDDVRCLVEDRESLFAGTVRGLLRIDLRTGGTRRYTRRDGLPSTEVTSCLRDRAGRVWIGTLGGLARFEPGPAHGAEAPGAFIERVRAGGRDVPVAPLGAAHVGPFEVEGDALVEVAAGSIAFAAGDVIRYQHRLAPHGAWSAPSAARELSLAGLAPGRYRLEVRAVNADGQASAVPATVELTLLAPVWRRGWFLALVACAAAGGAVLALRARDQRVASRARVAALADANRELERRVEDGIARLRESERMAAYGQLVAGVAHEIRHPVFALRTAAYLLGQHGAGDGKLAAPLATLRDETDRITRLVDDLLSYAREPQLVVRATPAAALLDAAVRSFRAARPDDAVALVTGGADLELRVDPDRLVQVLVNLLVNAVQHGEARAVTLTVSAAPGGACTVEVTDDGRGIPAEQLPRVFDPFVSGGRGGTGLGLAISKRLVEAHGGTIAARSAAGHGTTFTITLPA